MRIPHDELQPLLERGRDILTLPPQGEETDLHAAHVIDFVLQPLSRYLNKLQERTRGIDRCQCGSPLYRSRSYDPCPQYEDD